VVNRPVELPPSHPWSPRIVHFPQPQTDWPGCRRDSSEGLVGGTRRRGRCHGDPWPAEGMDGQWNEGGRQGNQSSVRPTSSMLYSTYCVSIAPSVRHTELASLSQAAILAGPSRWLGAPEQSATPPTETSLILRAPVSLGGNQPEPAVCKRRFCLWSHPSRGQRSFIKGGWNFVFSEPPLPFAPGPLTSAPGRVAGLQAWGKQAASCGWVAPGLLRSGGPCIRRKQLACPCVSRSSAASVGTRLARF
jgi:hypothetical protein